MINFFHNIWHKPEQGKQQHQLSLRIRKLKRNMHATLQHLLKEQLVEPQQSTAIDNIVQYYLDQPNTTMSDLTHMEQLVNKFKLNVLSELQRCSSNNDTDWLKRKLRTFWLLLPDQVSAYNRAFYDRQLEPLITALAKTRHSYQQQLQH